MRLVVASALGLFLWSLATPTFAIEPIRSTEELVAAVKNAKEGDTIELAAGKFELDATLELKGKMTLKGWRSTTTCSTSTRRRTTAI